MTNALPKIDLTDDIVSAHGLKPEEYQLLVETLGRAPNIVELAMVGAMWSEHCSYKSSKKWLKTLPTSGPQVIQGPGENAGVIDIGDGQAAVFKIESHNSPSRIEPFQGAATGVGGILRDIFTMGARPIANLNALRFGDPKHPNTQRLLDGVVGGIAHYGNCVGVPTIAGECEFHAAYNENCLVNAMTVGLADADKIFYAKAAGVGNAIVYVGAKTGRDGIGGATMSSEGFEDDIDDKRPTVQVGDPFTEKLLIEACLELMREDAIIAIQDMGAAGLTSSAFEMASKGGVGIEMWIDKIPAREDGMTAYDFMLSESQERMLMVLKPGSEDKAAAIFKKWELDFSIIGKVTDTGHVVLIEKDEVVSNVPVDIVVDNAPEYARPWTPTPPQKTITHKMLSKAEQVDLGTVLVKLMGGQHMASRAWIWQQYDHMVMGDTCVMPGADGGVVRVHGTHKGLAMTTDCTPRYVEASPYEGAKQAVAESYRNLSAVGAKPLAVTNNLNFGNPERPQIMGQIVESVKGMGTACEALDTPVVSGNVSLYNETRGVGVRPTPVVGMVGVIRNLANVMTPNVKDAGQHIVLIGQYHDAEKGAGWMGSTLFLSEILGEERGAPPPVDLEAEKLHADFVRLCCEEGFITAAHDVSDGGLICAVTEMLLGTKFGAKVSQPESSDLPAYAFWFGEDQARFVVTTDDLPILQEKLREARMPYDVLGQTTASKSLIFGDNSVDMVALKTVHSNWFDQTFSG